MKTDTTNEGFDVIAIDELATVNGGGVPWKKLARVAGRAIPAVNLGWSIADGISDYKDQRSKGKSRGESLSHAGGEALKSAVWGDLWGPFVSTPAY
jgi:hypothetical protein